MRPPISFFTIRDLADLKDGIRDFSVKGRGARFGNAILIGVRFYDAEIGKCLLKVSQFAHSWFDPVT